MHEVGVKDTKDRFVSDNEEIILFALEFENDGLEANCEIMVGLSRVREAQLSSRWGLASARG